MATDLENASAIINALFDYREKGIPTGPQIRTFVENFTGYTDGSETTEFLAEAFLDKLSGRISKRLREVGGEATRQQAAIDIRAAEDAADVLYVEPDPVIP